MEQNIQFIQTTPADLTEQILKAVNKSLDAFKENFQPKGPTEWLTREQTSKMLSISLVTLHD